MKIVRTCRLGVAVTVMFMLTTQFVLLDASKTRVAIGAGCIGCIWLFNCVKVVTSGDECLVERFGKYDRKLSPGWHIIRRPFESVSFHVTTREQVMDVPPQQCYTVDNAPITADAVVYMRVMDLYKARYEVRDVKDAILNLCLTQLREEVGKLTLDECFSSRDRINKALLENLNGVCANWGIEITRIEIQEMRPSPDILSAMEMQMAAERKKRAAILRSEGERITLTNEAEGRANAILTDSKAKAESTIMLAKAQAERMRLEAEGMKAAITEIANSIQTQNKECVDAALQAIMLRQYLETQAKFAGTNNTKVLMFPTRDSLPLTYNGLESLLRQ